MAQPGPVLEHARRTHEGFTLELSRPAEGLRLDSLGGWTSWQRPHHRNASKSKGVSPRYVMFEGGHDCAAWKRTLPGALRWALGG